jgi:signal transduction histidine kinase/ActR/RegA family two-component response regulator
MNGGGDPDELRKLRAVLDLSRAIGVEHDLERLASRVLDTCFQLLGAERGMIVAFLPQSKTPCATVAKSRTGAPIGEAVSACVLGRVLATRKPSIEVVHCEAEQASRSVIVMPLHYEAGETECLGMIYLDALETERAFVERDLELLDAIGGQAALAIKNALLVRQQREVRSEDWQRLERVVASLPVGVLVLDDQKRCVLANDWVAQKILGQIPPGTVLEQIAGIACDRLIAGELHEQVTLGSPEATLVIHAHPSADGREAVIVINDITAERAQQARVAHNERLALIGQLAGGIAHDFNNLLFVILNYSEMMHDALTSPHAKEDARTVIDAAKSAADLVRQLLVFSRREPFKPTIVDVATEIATRAKLVQRALGAEVELAIEHDGETAYVLIDRSQLEQIVLNLAVNARDAMNAKGHLGISIRSTPRSVILEVSDSGCGMTPDVMARVFEPYFTTKARGKGTGLGLATVQGIVQHANGAIEVYSQPGRGTTFTITLPRSELAPAIAQPLHALAPARGRVLVVDDDEQVRRLTERMLRRAGYDVSSVDSGAAALGEARRAPFDIVLTDVVMPGMSGGELATELEREFPDLHVILMSGYTHTPVRGHHFIPKPFDRNTLLALLDETARTARRAATAVQGR